VPAAGRSANSEGGTCFRLAFDSGFIGSFNSNLGMVPQFACCYRLRFGIVHASFDMFALVRI
jgi:hypothetical protein